MPREASDRRHRGPVSRAGTAYVRTRTVTACQVCRARRAKCDNERPCASCRRIGATCSSEPVSSTDGFDPASLAILAKLREIEGQLKSLSGRSHERPRSRKGAAVLELPSTNLSEPPAATGSSPSSPSSPAYSTVPTPDSSTLHLPRSLQRGNLGQVLAWPVWEPHQPPQDPRSGDITPNSDSVLLTRRQPAGIDHGLDITLFAEYLDAFFRNVHVLNPVLDEAQVRAQLTNSLLTGVGWDADSCLLLLILANGACSSSFGSEAVASHTSPSSTSHRDPLWARAQALFDAAEKRKDSLWRSSHLTQARCCFYSGVFMMVSARPFDAWRHFLQGLATCQGFTMASHRSKSRDPTQVGRQAEESIYWSCWKSERELRFELDVPDLASAGYDHPVMFPTLPQVSGEDELRTWYFYLAEISLWRFEMKARQSMADFAKQKPIALDSLAQRVIDLDVSLASWQASLPEAIRLDASAESSTADILPFVLRGRLTYNFEALSWPFLEALLLHGSRNISARAAELAARAVRNHYERLTINRPGFYYRHHGTWLMQRSSARSACVLLAVARSQSAHLLPADWLTIVSETVAMLEHWSDERSQDGVVVFLKALLSDFAQ